VLKTFCFLLLKADTQNNPWIFLHYSHEQITVKTHEFYPATFDLLVTNGLKLQQILSHVQQYFGRYDSISAFHYENVANDNFFYPANVVFFQLQQQLRYSAL
jgi:hypothetical protein